jgi:hypothetical protein
MYPGFYESSPRKREGKKKARRYYALPQAYE